MRTRGVGLAVMLVPVGLLTAGAAVGARTAAPGPWPPSGALPHSATAALDSRLAQVFGASLVRGAGAALSTARSEGIAVDDGEIRVIVQPGGNGVAAAEAEVTAAGGRVEAQADGLVQAVVPPGSLDQLASSGAVADVRPPAMPIPDALGLPPFGSQGAELSGGGEVGEGQFGWSVALSADGSTALVGADADGTVGAAWVFTRTGSTWAEQGPKLVPNGAVASTQFGFSVALSADGNTALIGGAGDNGENGAAWVFTRSGSTWTQQGAKLDGSDATGAGELGFEVALSSDGNTALVGAPADASSLGAAWVFTRSGSTWTQQGSKLSSGGGTAPGDFGISVALSGDGNTALIGGDGDSTNGFAGGAWVFTRSAGAWTQQGPMLVGGSEAGAGQFGFSVALSTDGQTALIGGPGDNNGSGAAWVFTRSGSTWSQEGSKLTASTTWFGWRVALSGDASLALVGNGGTSSSQGTGRAWMITHSGSNWTVQASPLTDPSGGTQFSYGLALSADGLTALAGAPGSGSGEGAASVFTPPADEALAPTGASDWHAAGYTGSGVKIAIVDLGFAGYQSLLGTALPASVTTDDRCDGNLSEPVAAGGTDHGTAVAELVHQMAPDAQLVLICIDTEVDLALGEQDAIAAGAQIVNHSVAWFNTSRGDGTGAAGSPDATVADARAHGILWVNAAGNYNREHWSGAFTPDADDPDVEDFSPGDTLNSVTVPSGESDCAFLKWDDWPVTTEDFDLYLVDESNDQIVDSSLNDQSDGPLPPTEDLCYTNTGPTRTFGLGIIRYSASTAPRFDLYWVGGAGALQYETAGSVTEPASSPNALAVGGECWQTGALETFSSQGPTIDGRAKPDLLAPDSVSTETYGAASAGGGGCGDSGFAGTSAASPQVAGAAALLLQQHPGLTAAQLAAGLEARSLARSGATQSADDVGNGRLALGSPAASGTIAYVSGQQISITDADGAGTHSLAGPAAAPSWSPDGSELAIDTSSGLETIGVDGTNRRVLVSVPGYGAEDPAWSPDGSEIAYANTAVGPGGIWVEPAAGGSPTELSSDPFVSAPVWSPDGSKIAFLSSPGSRANPPNIWIMNADGSSPTELATTNAPIAGGLDYRNLAWSPDGGKLLYVTSASPLALEPPESIAVANTNGSGDQILVQTFADVSFSDPSWSPDGAKISFDDSTLSGPGPIASPPGLDVADADGGGRHQLLGIDGIQGAQWASHDIVSDLSPPTISGTAAVGSSLEASPGLWTATSGSTFGLAWMRCNSTGGNCAPIGASDRSYTASAGDAGSSLRVQITETYGVSSISATSAASSVITVATPFATDPPTISGNPVSGQTLSVGSNGAWNGSPTFTYQWRRCADDGSTCTNISGQATASYTVTGADVGSTIRLAVTGTNAGGSRVATSIAITATAPSGGGGGGGAGSTTTTTVTVPTTTTTATIPFVTSPPPVPSSSGSGKGKTKPAPATLAVSSLKTITLSVEKPRLSFVAKVSKATELRLTLFDSKGKKLAGWSKHAHAGANVLSLLLPAKARHKGHEKLRLTVTGNSTPKTFTVTLVS